jgi:magnesium chelatase accessory protein
MQLLPLAWERDGRDWPLREASQFVMASGLRWHVQMLGTQRSDAPAIWLLHGTGASTHSWRGLMPLLARDFRVAAVDLPGHGFTAMPLGGAASPLFTLPGMAAALASLMHAVDLRPDIMIGHSAGAAVAARMCLDALVAPGLLIGINAALLPLDGLAGRVYAPMARWMAASARVPRWFARRAADPRMREKLIAATGSVLDPTGQGLYGRLMQDAGHASAALAMMANWDLHALARDLPRLRNPMHLCVGEGDKTVAPMQSARVLVRLRPHPMTAVSSLGRLGHMAHEERPALVAELVRSLQRLLAQPGPMPQDIKPCHGVPAPDPGMSTTHAVGTL